MNLQKRHVGIDVGSTTIKSVILDENYNIVHSSYRRHLSDIKGHSEELLKELSEQLEGYGVTMAVTGSAGMFLSDKLGIPFVQEVVACTNAIERNYPQTDVVIELGGEDAKITYFGASLEQRMNGVCAGGTGAFIDQMASLLNTDAAGLNSLAKNAKVTYPIASRCGVFAKTDIQPLLNEGTPKEDIAASVIQAVVFQTISGLACGKPIKGNVAFLGGPLHFLDELRFKFIEHLKLKPEEVIYPDDSQYYVALGAALYSAEAEKHTHDIHEYVDHMGVLKIADSTAEDTLDPLFENEEEYNAFVKRHEEKSVPKGDIEKYEGPAFFGLDAGSTTTKAVLIGKNHELLYTWYGGNKGNPLSSSLDILKDMYSKMNGKTYIAKSAVTGYGEHLLKAALKIDIGEIETVAHYKGADFFLPGVEFVLDIGGQDMKSLKIKGGYIESISLNEACSSGCGSFIETFAKSLRYSVQDFAKEAIYARKPVDLGSRCTVFMNSKVKQAQKEGATVGDISAGISYSVIRNALYKVIRLRSADELGKKVVVQGGTFKNNAVLRCFEKITGLEVVRPDIAGTMGAFGCALIAKSEYDLEEEVRAGLGNELGAVNAESDEFKSDPLLSGVSDIIKADMIDSFTVKTKQTRCNHCGNHCMLTINTFPDTTKFVSGNRCEKGAGAFRKNVAVPDLYEYKYNRIFDYKPLEEGEAKNGVIGIPRVLNMYETYPFWFTLLTRLGYRVVISGRSSRDIYSKGMDSIPSESACYPAKIAHGHVEDLIDMGVKKIFYPSVPYEIKDDPKADNHFNCPIVTSYPEVIKLNVDRLHTEDVKLLNGFFPLYDKKAMLKISKRELPKLGISIDGLEAAIEAAYDELDCYRADVRKAGEDALKYCEEKGAKAVILAGRPYHIDPEINHGIPSMITGYGLVVLSEDSIMHLASTERPLRVVDQWTYHSRMYRAANFAVSRQDVEMVQLNSFGCGLDAVTTDQVNEILEKHNKPYTLLKIDEINNLGAARIRIRSLLAVMNERSKVGIVPVRQYEDKPRIIFTEEMKKNHTILCPQMSPIHFQFLETAMVNEGYKLEVLTNFQNTTVEEGLKVVHNDACYPSIIVVGQIVEALKSGKYDLNNTSVIISQTGGGCRATNYIAFIRKALKDQGLEHIPVVSFNAGGLESNPGFKMTPSLLNRLMMAMVYGDLLMRVTFKTRPYEKVKGSVNQLCNQWSEKLKLSLENAKFSEFKNNIKAIVKDFDEIEILDIKKPKVGIVGEILIKFSEDGNNKIVEFLESEGAEAVMPDLTDFFMYSGYNFVIRHDMLGASYKAKLGGEAAIFFMERYRDTMKKALHQSKRFEPPKHIKELAESASEVVSLGHQTGEGWFLTAEIIELLESGVDNVACLQPFGCLPNHVTGKGVIKELRKIYPKSNIAPIDYDPGASEVNQINRLRLMLSNAYKHMKEEMEAEKEGQ